MTLDDELAPRRSIGLWVVAALAFVGVAVAGWAYANRKPTTITATPLPPSAPIEAAPTLPPAAELKPEPPTEAAAAGAAAVAPTPETTPKPGEPSDGEDQAAAPTNERRDDDRSHSPRHDSPRKPPAPAPVEKPSAPPQERPKKPPPSQPAAPDIMLNPYRK